MEHKSPANITATISMITAAISIIMDNIQAYVSLTAAAVAVLSGIMAIRHYYYSTKKNKRRKEAIKWEWIKSVT
ncbi:hypothetical protein TH53_19705 [Pedobacter lusitanus]|uniref:Uncharacterized protein n=2 Tax=Pedobacter lusitanus TaxID=1503925 RepID=A0A0D0GDZ3_9SPHI|nr:hypothetical protein TH53_19705 [Pedobacter lusitanus]